MDVGQAVNSRVPRRGRASRGAKRQWLSVTAWAFIASSLALACIGSWPETGVEALVGWQHLRNLFPRRTKMEEENERTDEETSVEKVGILDVQLVELQVESPPSRVDKLFVPLAPQVAKWWTDSNELLFSYRLERSLTSKPQIHVQVSGVALEIGNIAADGIHAAVEMPDGAILEACQVGMVRVVANVPSLAELGPIKALRLVCPVQPSSRGGLARTLPLLMSSGHPMRWFLLPWVLLLLPFIVGSSIGPVALLGGAALTLASIACLSFIIAILIVVIQKKFMHWTRRWRRLWRLRSLARNPSQISAAFGASGPCCICLGESSGQDSLIALLPCRHALHAECYCQWVSADSYPSHNLICPVCRRRADAIGKLSPLEEEEP